MSGARVYILMGVIGVALSSALLFLQRNTSVSPIFSPGLSPFHSISAQISPIPVVPSPDTLSQQSVELFSATSLSRVSPAYKFSMYVPRAWEAETVRANASINLYDPALTGPTNLEKSQVFIRYFRANTFLTLQYVNIISREQRTVAGRPAVSYVIEKKPSYANFQSQPAWRNIRHRVVDVRVSDTSPSTFYVFAKSPDLADAVFDAMLDTLVFHGK